MKFDSILESPGLLLTSQRKSTVDDLVKLDEGLKKLRVSFGVTEVVAKESGELPEAVQTASSNHIQQFFGRECDVCGLYGT